MNVNRIHRIINPLLFVSFVIQAITSLYFIFEIRVSYISIIAKIHATNGTIMIILVIIHLVLNWSWIKINIFKKHG